MLSLKSPITIKTLCRGAVEFLHHYRIRPSSSVFVGEYLLITVAGFLEKLAAKTLLPYAFIFAMELMLHHTQLFEAPCTFCQAEWAIKTALCVF